MVYVSEDAISITRGRIPIILARLCTSRFDKSNLRSKSGATSERDIINIDKSAAVRGRWTNRLEFLLSCIGFAVGLGNVWRFPIRVYESGGGAFLIPYMILCVILGVPLLLLELGLAQFSGFGPTKTFKLVPIFYGIGWCMVIVSILIEVYYASIIAWGYFYLFGSLRVTMPWTVCTNNFNTETCLGSLDKSNSSKVYTSSTTEYWEYYVTGFIKYPSREPYVMNENPGSPQWHLTLCLLLTWVICALSLMYGVKVSGKIMYFTVLYPYVALFALFCVGCTLPGAMEGIRFYLTPDWSKIFQAKILRGAVEQLFFSASLAMGGMLTYASYNDFRDNFFRDSIIIIFIDFFTSMLAGFAVFPILGYMARRNGVKIEKVVTSGSSLFFITFTEALATLPGSQFWTVLLMLMAVSLGMDSQFAMFETVSTAVMDAFTILQNSYLKKALLVWILCFVYFLFGLLLVTPGGKFWFEILDNRVSSFGLPIIAFMETICVGQIYGIKQLRYDFRMMMGYSLSWYWFFMIGYVSPVMIFSILIASFVHLDRMTVEGQKIPIWGEIVATILLLILISPLFIGMIHTIVKYSKKYPELKGKMFLLKLISPPVYWGPFYKKHWLLGSFYREKLREFKDDPIFIKYVSSVEDLDLITELAERSSRT